MVSGAHCSLCQFGNNLEVGSRRGQNQAILGAALGRDGISRLAEPLHALAAMFAIGVELVSLHQNRRQLVPCHMVVRLQFDRPAESAATPLDALCPLAGRGRSLSAVVAFSRSLG